MFPFLHWVALKWAKFNYEDKKPKKKKEKKIRVSPLLYI